MYMTSHRDYERRIAGVRYSKATHKTDQLLIAELDGLRQCLVLGHSTSTVSELSLK